MKLFKDLRNRLFGPPTISVLELRKSLSPHEIYDRYYFASGLDEPLVVELLRHVAEEMRLPLEKLLPTDRFSVELAQRTREWDSGYGALLVELIDLAKSRKMAIKDRIETIDDYVRTAGALYGEQRGRR